MTRSWVGGQGLIMVIDLSNLKEQITCLSLDIWSSYVYTTSSSGMSAQCFSSFTVHVSHWGIWLERSQSGLGRDRPHFLSQLQVGLMLVCKHTWSSSVTIRRGLLAQDKVLEVFSI